jgi:phosphate transport system substrate-binding protein
VRHARPILAAALALAVVAVPATAATNTLSISGSTSIAPLMTQLIAKYKTVNPQIGFAPLKQGGSDVGVAQAASGQVSIGMSSRDHLASDPHGLAFNKIARDAICIITNPANPVTGLSQTQVQQIFTGQVRTWSGVPGAKATGTIALISRTASSGTADAFQNIFLGPNLKIAANAAQKGSNGLVQQAVHQNKQAIGFVSLDFITGTHPVSYKGVPCTLRNAKAGSYAGVRNFWLVTKGLPVGPAKTFISWIQTAPAALKIIETHWLPLK